MPYRGETMEFDIDTALRDARDACDARGGGDRGGGGGIAFDKLGTWSSDPFPFASSLGTPPGSSTTTGFAPRSPPNLRIRLRPASPPDTPLLATYPAVAAITTADTYGGGGGGADSAPGHRRWPSGGSGNSLSPPSRGKSPFESRRVSQDTDFSECGRRSSRGDGDDGGGGDNDGGGSGFGGDSGFGGGGFLGGLVAGVGPAWRITRIFWAIVNFFHKYARFQGVFNPSFFVNSHYFLLTGSVRYS